MDSIITHIMDYATEVHAVADAEVRKLRHDPSEILTRAIQPAIWLVLFGEVMAQVRGLATGNGRYIDFLAPGILAQSVLFAAIFTASLRSGNATSASSTATWSVLPPAAPSCWARRFHRQCVASRRPSSSTY